MPAAGSESLTVATKAGQRLATSLAGRTLAAGLQTIDSISNAPALRCAAEAALLDLAGQRLDEPLNRLFDCETQPRVAVNASLGSLDTATPARAAAAVGIDGLFIEVHPNPDEALCDGPNSLRLDRLPALLEQRQEGGFTIYVIESIPHEEAAVVWGHIEYEVRKKDTMPLEARYYDEDGGLVAWSGGGAGLGLRASAPLSQVRYDFDEEARRPDLFPSGQLDADLQQLVREESGPGGRIYFMCHFDHPREFTEPAIEAVDRLLRLGAGLQVEAWRTMLDALALETPAEFVDWFAVDREFGHETPPERVPER